jgi:glycosyltransferase involved in cell wall biosynthesis
VTLSDELMIKSSYKIFKPKTKMNRKIKLTYIFTHQIRWVQFEWVAQYTDNSKFDIDYLILNEGDPIVDFLQQMEIPYKTTFYNDYRNTPEVVKFIYDHLVENKTDIVHTHWFAGHLAGLQAAYYAKVPVRVYTTENTGIKWTRHARSKYELIWQFATNAIAVTNQVKAGMIADGVPEDQITVIPSGFDLTQYENIDPQRIKQLQDKYLKNHTGPVIGVSARYVKWKGVEYIIEAFKKVLETHPNALLLLSGTHTDTKNIQEQFQNITKDSTNKPNYAEALSVVDKLAELPADSYVEIYFEEDLFALFRLFDIFVHVSDPMIEAFGQSPIDAMLSEVPSVITATGIAQDFAIHKEHAWIVDSQNSQQIAEGILTLLEDKSLREKIKQNALISAKNYSIQNKMLKLEELYLRGCFKSS